MQKRHSDPELYIQEQITSTKKFVLPYIGTVKPVIKGLKVLEIGCGQAGNLKPFLDLGCKCTGVDFSLPKIEKGRLFYATHPYAANINLISEDIYQIKEFESNFDIIILRDVIEHIHDQKKFLGLMKNLMAPGGIAFFAFPPWQNPFGGHQQVCKSFLSKVPYIHLLPKKLYCYLLRWFGEEDGKITELLEIKETGISIERFEQCCQKNEYKITKKTLYLINPNYEIKFGLRPVKLAWLIAGIPWLRNFYTTAAYYILSV
jgi:SAM-dependent methyltransferase